MSNIDVFFPIALDEGSLITFVDGNSFGDIPQQEELVPFLMTNHIHLGSQQEVQSDGIIMNEDQQSAEVSSLLNYVQNEVSIHAGDNDESVSADYEENLEPKLALPKRKMGARWTSKEKAALEMYINTHKENDRKGREYWDNCAAFIKDKVGVTRSGHSCKIALSRWKIRVLGSESKTATQQNNAQQVILTRCLSADHSYITGRPTKKSKSCPRNRSRCDMLITSIKNPKVPSPLADDPISSKIRKHAKRRISIVDDVSYETRGKLLSAVTTGSVSDIISAVWESAALKRSIKNKLLQEIEEDVESLLHMEDSKKKVSVLNAKDYKSLMNFSWNSIVEEMLEQNSMLSEILLSAVFPTKILHDMPSEKLAKMVPRLGMIYSIMMQSRWHQLSLVQRLHAKQLCEEMTAQKIMERMCTIGVSLLTDVTRIVPQP